MNLKMASASSLLCTRPFWNARKKGDALNTSLLVYSNCQRPSTTAGVPLNGSEPLPDASRDLIKRSTFSLSAWLASVPLSRAATCSSSASFVAVTLVLLLVLLFTLSLRLVSKEYVKVAAVSMSVDAERHTTGALQVCGAC